MLIFLKHVKYKTISTMRNAIQKLLEFVKFLSSLRTWYAFANLKILVPIIYLYIVK